MDRVKDPGELNAEIRPCTLATAYQAAEIGIVWDAVTQAVCRGCKSDLGVAHVLARHLRAELIHDELVILDGLEAAGHGEVDLEEVVEVAKGEPLAQTLLGLGRQRHAIAPRQGEQRGGLDRAFEMDMQLHLRRRVQIGCERHV